MTAKNQRRGRRGLILSDSGLARVNRARRRLELARDEGRVSLEQLSADLGLSTKTLSRLFGRRVPVDRRTIELLFAGLDLALDASDVAAPPSRRDPHGAALPHYRTVLFGREAELERLRVLARDRMVVTLTGPGGVGKTRLAVEWSHAATDAYAHVVFLDLSLFTDGGTFREALAGALDGVANESDDVLAVLDGCEHIIDAAAVTVDEVLRARPHVSVLATSREPLGVAGEAILRVAALPVPAANSMLSTADALRSPAFAMFVERARTFDDGFSVGEDAVEAVAEIVRRLDGIPLSLELAAARAAFMSLPDLLESLRDHLEALRAGPRAGVPRHRSARSSIDWSFALLSEDERGVFCRLSAFMGSFDALGVGAVCAGCSAESVGDVLAQLVRKSLLMRDAGNATTRYRMLETIRQYAAEKLAERGEAAQARQLHALYYHDVAARWAAAIGTADQERALSELQRENPNLREALAWCTSASANVYLGAAIAAHLFEFWDACGDLAAGEHWLRRALESESETVTAVNRAKLHEGLALIVFRRGRLAETVAHAAEALRSYAWIGDDAGKLRARDLLGAVALATGETISARDQFEANLTEGRANANARAVSSSLNNLGRLVAEGGQPADAMPLFTESLAVAREGGLLSLVVVALRNLAECAGALGQPGAALTYARLGTAEARKLGNREALADLALQTLAQLVRLEGLSADARDEALKAWEALRTCSSRHAMATPLDALAAALHERGMSQQAALLSGAAAAFRRRTDAPSVTSRAPARLQADIAAALPPGEADALFSRGTALSLEDAFREALLDAG